MNYYKTKEIITDLADDALLGRFTINGKRLDREYTEALLIEMLNRLYPNQAPYTLKLDSNGYFCNETSKTSPRRNIVL